MVDQTDLDALERALRPETKLIWVETPTNPLLNVVDVEGVVARSGGALVAVDNTFATPAVQRPLELGADAVVHSATKYLGGHSDTVGGAVIAADADLHDRVRFVQNAVGAVPGPLDCFLVHRGLRTLHLRVAAHSENGAAVSEFLRGVDGVEDVRWPGFGGMVSFRHPRRGEHRGRDPDLRAGRVARRGRVADRGAPGDDASVGRGLGGRRAARPGPALLRRRGRRGPRRGSAPGARLNKSVWPNVRRSWHMPRAAAGNSRPSAYAVTCRGGSATGRCTARPLSAALGRRDAGRDRGPAAGRLRSWGRRTGLSRSPSTSSPRWRCRR